MIITVYGKRELLRLTVLEKETMSSQTSQKLSKHSNCRPEMHNNMSKNIPVIVMDIGKRILKLWIQYE